MGPFDLNNNHDHDKYVILKSTYQKQGGLASESVRKRQQYNLLVDWYPVLRKFHGNRSLTFSNRKQSPRREYDNA